MVGITALLAVAAARTWHANHALARSISEERDRLNKLNDQEKADLAILNEPQNQDVRQRSQALNALIVRKSLSWTRIFNDLEKMMPTGLHVVSIAPQLSATNELQIRMTVAGSSRTRALELVQSLEKAPDFRDAQIVSETNTATGRNQAQAGDAVTFNIVAQYSPAAAPPASTAQATAAAEKQSEAPAPAVDARKASDSKARTQGKNAAKGERH